MVPALAAHAQQTRVYRVGALLVGNADASSFRNELREELRKGGYVEGQNLIFEIRSAEEKLELPKLAAELVSLKVDVVVAIYTPCAIAAKQATHGGTLVLRANLRSELFSVRGARGWRLAAPRLRSVTS